MMLLRAINTHYRRQNRSFKGNATQREKQQDWMAERMRFELAVLFATDSAFLVRNSHLVSESQPESAIRRKSGRPKCLEIEPAVEF